MTIEYISGRYPKAMAGVAVLALACFAGSGGTSMADVSGVPAEAGLEQSTKRPAAGAVDQGPTRPTGPLTVQQKRIFVLGLGTSEKN